MKHEILLKAYVQHQSEDAFRDLVAGTLDEVYSTSLKIARGAPYLAEQIALSAYLELARKAPALSQDVVLAAWLRERTCKIAVRILRAEDRFIDWAVLKQEQDAVSIPAGLQPAPPGLAIRICQNIFFNKRGRLFPSLVGWPAWIQPRHVGGAAICAIAFMIWWGTSFQKRDPILLSQGALMTPSSFAQRASPEEGGPPPPSRVANTGTGHNSNQP